MQSNTNNTAPSGAKILETLIKLYAKQEGVKITYRLENSKNENGKTR